MNLLTNTGMSLGQIGRKASIILIDHLNDEITSLEASYEDDDREYAEKRGVIYIKTIVDRFDPVNIHYGFIPSMINAPIEDIPCLTVITDEALPSGEEFDHIDNFSISMAIEFMCKASEHESPEVEELTNRRAERTLEAIYNVMTAHRTLDGLVQEIQMPPTVGLTELFLRAESTQHGSAWAWQGGRIEYEVTKPSPV